MIRFSEVRLRAALIVMVALSPSATALAQGDETSQSVSGGYDSDASAFGLANEAAAVEAASLEEIPVAAPAEEEHIDGRGEHPRNRVVEEIIVTAQKREENILDVPLSIQAFSGDAMAARGIDDTIQLGQVIPSLQFTGVGGFTLLSLRGVGTDNFVPSADPSVATYVDGIYIPAGQGATTSLGNIQRVEVLKGPQGTLFGRNATGGAINIVTEEPDDQLRISTEAEIGNFSARSVRLSASGPITDWLSVGISGLSLYKDNYYTNIFAKTQDTRQDVGRVKLRIHPDETLSLNLTALHSKQEGSATTIGKNTAPSLLGRLIGITPQKEDFRGENDFNAVANATQKIYYGTLETKFSALDVKLLGSHVYVVTDPSDLDFDGSRLPIAAFDAENLYSKMQTAELQFLSNDGSWLSDRLRWVGGFYYLRGEAGGNPVKLHAAPNGLETVLNILDLELPTGLLDLLDRLPAAGTPLGDDGVVLSFRGILQTRSYSAFLQTTYDITDSLDVIVGARAQREKRFISSATTSAVTPVTGEELTLFNFTPPPAETAKTVSPKAVVSYRPADGKMLYASYSVGYKSGTFNNVNIYQPPNYIKPEQVRAVELGAKLGFLDGLLQINGAAFNNDIRDLQSGFVSLLSGGAVQFLTVPAARTRGAELDGSWIPFADWNPGLVLTGNTAYVDATYTDFPAGPGFEKTTGIYSNRLNFTGNRIVRVPKWSGSVGFVQSLGVPGGALEFGADQYHNSGFYYDSYNTTKEKPYSIVNARISYLHERSNARVTLYGKNVLDERYHVQQLQTDFGLVSTLAAPREYGIRVNWDF